MFGAGLIESRQASDVMHIGSLGFGSEVAQLHILDHALTKWCHAKAPWNLDWSFCDNLIQCFAGASRQATDGALSIRRPIPRSGLVHHTNGRTTRKRPGSPGPLQDLHRAHLSSQPERAQSIANQCSNPGNPPRQSATKYSAAKQRN